ANEIFDTKADKSDTYTKTETDTLLDAKADKTELIDSYTKTETDSKLDEKADKNDTYTKTETDTLLDDKADKNDTYTKTETDTLLDDKADKNDTYTKTETDTLLDYNADKTDIIDAYSKAENDALLLLKADTTELIDAYTKTETDTLLDDKADKTDLANYVDLTSAQTIYAYKYFQLISVSSIQKQGKNDASILLAGGGDMLVSSLVTQPQLQEVRDIATGKSKAYVFSTQEELNDWMAIQDNVAKLVIGDNLYIVDKEVTDYWWDGTDLKVLETEQPDMSNVITTLGTATGSSNAITDISIDGNVLTPAKNTTFVTTGFDQSITGMKTFTNTIISNGIQYSGYDNSSVFLAGGGVRSFADIQSVSYTKSEDDALLLLKADKTELIDSYTKTETNNLLNSKTDNGVSYTKGEDYAHLLLKADKTELIDSYTKTETNNLLNSKTDNGVSYIKSEDDALLLLKADKTELIDSYTKTETNNLLNNKTNTGVSYTKSEDEALLLLKADKTELIDSYTKTETNNLLNNKSDTGVSYTKGEDDTLLFAKADKTQLIDSYTKTETNNLLNNKANQSTTYTKTETDQLISQIDTGNVDLTDYYNKTKTDELLGEKANTTDLSNYMTLGTSQTITANKTFNNACRFVSSIDGMSTVTGSSFVKSGADDTVVLLGAGGTKPISEFAGSPTDLSNYYTKTQTYSQTEASNRFVQFKGSIQQTITGRLKYVSPFGETYDETQDPVANTYLTMSEVDAKLSSKMDSSTLGNLVNTIQDQTVNGSKTFTSNVSATGFVKTDKDDTSVLLAGGGDKLISSFGGLTDLTTTQLSSLHGNINFGTMTFSQIGNLRFLFMVIHPYSAISSGSVTGICTISYFHRPQASIKVSIQGDTTNTFKAEIGSSTGTLTIQSSSQAWAINASFSLNVFWCV
ncbi:MAG: hypothetical protein EZS28_025987, partial [Streblomastix strix]